MGLYLQDSCFEKWKGRGAFGQGEEAWFVELTKKFHGEDHVDWEIVFPEGNVISWKAFGTLDHEAEGRE